MKKTSFTQIALAAIFVFSFSLAPVNAQEAPQAQIGPVLTPPAHPDSPKPTEAPQPGTVQGQDPQQKPQAEAFDGAKLYNEAFKAIYQLHIKLDSPESLEAFKKEWEHKFDKSGELSSEEGTDKAIGKMMQSFGLRFDYFFDKQATEAEHQQIDATLSGIGATLRLSKASEILKGFEGKKPTVEELKKAIAISKENRLLIDEPMEGSPAEKSGLLPGDAIIKVDGKDLDGMQQDEAVKLIKGKAGSQVNLSIERTKDDGTSESLDLSITRAKVSVPVVKFKDLGDGISYVKLRDFMSKNAVSEMHAALKKAGKGKALVLDLRGNPGGSLPAVLTMVGMILEDGPVLVTRSRVGERIVESEISLNKNFVLRMEPSESDPDTIEVSTGPRPKLLIPNEMPIVVLVDEGSASASEILSGVLQHNRRAVVIGMPSTGKGVGQTVVQLPFGRSLHVTSFEFIPGRTPNDWVGVLPDIELKRGDDPKLDLQLEKAKEVLAPMIKSQEQMRQKREELLKKNQEEFQKELQERQKGN